MQHTLHIWGGLISTSNSCIRMSFSSPIRRTLRNEAVYGKCIVQGPEDSHLCESSEKFIFISRFCLEVHVNDLCGNIAYVPARVDQLSSAVLQAERNSVSAFEPSFLLGSFVRHSWTVVIGGPLYKGSETSLERATRGYVHMNIKASPLSHCGVVESSGAGVSPLGKDGRVMLFSRNLRSSTTRQ